MMYAVLPHQKKKHNKTIKTISKVMDWWHNILKMYID